MIRPRRGDTGIDPALLTGVLGAAVALDALRSLIAELAADGDRGAPGDAAAVDVDGAADGAVLDAVLGLAALAAQALPRERATAPMSADDPLPAIDLAVQELLR